jgi:hypothetical protein
MKNYLLTWGIIHLYLINSTLVMADNSHINTLLSNKNTIPCDQIATVQNVTGKVTLIRPNQKNRPIKNNDFLCRNDRLSPQSKATLTVICHQDKRKITITNSKNIQEICQDQGRYIKDQGDYRGVKMAQDTTKPNIITPENNAPVSYNSKFPIRWNKVENATKYIVKIKRFRQSEIWTETTTNNEIEYPNLPLLETGPSYDLIVETVKSDQSVVTLKTKFFIEK